MTLLFTEVILNCHKFLSQYLFYPGKTYLDSFFQIFIVSETGAISLKRSLNYEDPSAPHTFILQVVAKDNGKPTLSSL